MTGTTRAKNAQAMCCLTINHTSFLMPADDGMKVAALMQKARRVDKDLDRESFEYTYSVRQEVTEVSWTGVQASQVRMPAPEPRPGRRAGAVLALTGPGAP